MTTGTTDLADTGPHTAGVAADLARAEYTIELLDAALTTSRVVGTAIGMLVERRRITVEDAFTQLVDSARRSQRLVSDVAEELVRTRRLPG